MHLLHKGWERFDVRNILKNQMIAIMITMLKSKWVASTKTFNCRLSIKKKGLLYPRSKDGQKNQEQVNKNHLRFNYRSLFQIFSYSCYKRKEIILKGDTPLVRETMTTVWVDLVKATRKRKVINQANVNVTSLEESRLNISRRSRIRWTLITLQSNRKMGIMSYPQWLFSQNQQSPRKTGILPVLRHFKTTNTHLWTLEKSLCRHLSPNSGSESEPRNMKIEKIALKPMNEKSPEPKSHVDSESSCYCLY